MRIEIEKLIKPLNISTKYFFKLLSDCNIKNRKYLSESDLKILEEKLNISTYKTVALYKHITEIIKQNQE